MGLAASQCRLLSLNSRMSDLELRAQMLSNQKVALSAASSQASNNYIRALNGQHINLFNPQGDSVEATAELLTCRDAYTGMDQLFLQDDIGQVLCSEDMLRAYEASGGDLETFLNRFGVTSNMSSEAPISNIASLLSSGLGAISNASEKVRVANLIDAGGLNLESIATDYANAREAISAMSSEVLEEHSPEAYTTSLKNLCNTMREASCELVLGEDGKPELDENGLYKIANQVDINGETIYDEEGKPVPNILNDEIYAYASMFESLATDEKLNTNKYYYSTETMSDTILNNLKTDAAANNRTFDENNLEITTAQLVGDTAESDIFRFTQMATNTIYDYFTESGLDEEKLNEIINACDLATVALYTDVFNNSVKSAFPTYYTDGSVKNVKVEVSVHENSDEQNITVSDLNKKTAYDNTNKLYTDYESMLNAYFGYFDAIISGQVEIKSNYERLGYPIDEEGSFEFRDVYYFFEDLDENGKLATHKKPRARVSGDGNGKLKDYDRDRVDDAKKAYQSTETYYYWGWGGGCSYYQQYHAAVPATYTDYTTYYRDLQIGKVNDLPTLKDSVMQQLREYTGEVNSTQTKMGEAQILQEAVVVDEYIKKNMTQAECMKGKYYNEFFDLSYYINSKDEYGDIYSDGWCNTQTGTKLRIRNVNDIDEANRKYEQKVDPKTGELIWNYLYDEDGKYIFEDKNTTTVDEDKYDKNRGLHSSETSYSDGGKLKTVKHYQQEVDEKGRLKYEQKIVGYNQMITGYTPVLQGYEQKIVGYEQIITGYQQKEVLDEDDNPVMVDDLEHPIYGDDLEHPIYGDDLTKPIYVDEPVYGDNPNDPIYADDLTKPILYLAKTDTTIASRDPVWCDILQYDFINENEKGETLYLAVQQYDNEYGKGFYVKDFPTVSNVLKIECDDDNMDEYRTIDDADVEAYRKQMLQKVKDLNSQLTGNRAMDATMLATYENADVNDILHAYMSLWNAKEQQNYEENAAKAREEVKRQAMKSDLTIGSSDKGFEEYSKRFAVEFQNDLTDAISKFEYEDLQKLVDSYNNSVASAVATIKKQLYNVEDTVRNFLSDASQFFGETYTYNDGIASIVNNLKSYVTRSTFSNADLIDIKNSINQIIDLAQIPKTCIVKYSDEATINYYQNIFNAIKNNYDTGKTPVSIKKELWNDANWLNEQLLIGNIHIAVNENNKLVTKQYNTSFTYVSTESLGDADLTKAQAEYEAEVARISKKEKRIDNELNMINTEHAAIENEIEGLKTNKDDNIEHGFNLFS